MQKLKGLSNDPIWFLNELERYNFFALGGALHFSKTFE